MTKRVIEPVSGEETSNAISTYPPRLRSCHRCYLEVDVSILSTCPRCKRELWSPIELAMGALGTLLAVTDAFRFLNLRNLPEERRVYWFKPGEKQHYEQSICELNTEFIQKAQRLIQTEPFSRLPDAIQRHFTEIIRSGIVLTWDAPNSEQYCERIENAWSESFLTVAGQYILPSIPPERDHDEAVLKRLESLRTETLGLLPDLAQLIGTGTLEFEDIIYAASEAAEFFEPPEIVARRDSRFVEFIEKVRLYRRIRNHGDPIEEVSDPAELCQMIPVTLDSGELPAKSVAESSQVPLWDAETHTLWLGAEKVRAVKRRAGIVGILEAFQRAGWQKEIRNPLGTNDSCRDMLSKFNKVCSCGFEIVGTGNGVSIMWSITDDK